jgi:hypothetical protein
MPRYLLLWKIDNTRIPIEAKERAMGWSMLTAMVKQDMEKGLTKDWGATIGEGTGYAIVEGNEMDVALMVQQYAPYVQFEVKPIMSVKQIDEMLKAMQG